MRKIVPKAISRVRKDLDSWRRALRQADSVDRPRRRELMDLYADVMLDALLTSQIEQRIGRTLSLEFSLKDASGKVDEEATRTLSSAVWFPLLIRYMLESVFYGHSLVEFSTSETDGIGVTLIPRQNVVPEQGLLLYDSTADEGAYYRELREYGPGLRGRFPTPAFGRPRQASGGIAPWYPAPWIHCRTGYVFPPSEGMDECPGRRRRESRRTAWTAVLSLLRIPPGEEGWTGRPPPQWPSGRWGAHLYRRYPYCGMVLCRLLVFSWYLDSSMCSVSNIC